jgi:hypothetical protein
MLEPPDLYRTVHRNVFDRLAGSSPLLEDLDLTGSASVRYLQLVIFDEELPRLPALLPKLKHIRLKTHTFKRETLIHFSDNMGQRLVELQVAPAAHNYEDYRCFSDKVFKVIGQSCTSLEKFRYIDEEHFRNNLTIQGVKALIRGCPKLNVLQLGVLSIGCCEQIDEFANKKKYRSLSVSVSLLTPR